MNNITDEDGVSLFYCLGRICKLSFNFGSAVAVNMFSIYDRNNNIIALLPFTDTTLLQIDWDDDDEIQSFLT